MWDRWCFAHVATLTVSTVLPAAVLQCLGNAFVSLSCNDSILSALDSETCKIFQGCHLTFTWHVCVKRVSNLTLFLTVSTDQLKFYCLALAWWWIRQSAGESLGSSLFLGKHLDDLEQAHATVGRVILK